VLRALAQPRQSTKGKAMRSHYFFGYGSLVNTRTHAYPDARRARLSGWRRVWRGTPLAEQAFLSVEPAQTEIHGLVAAVPDADWGALDAREHGYDRQGVVSGIAHDLPDHAAVQVYAVPDRHHLPLDRSPILLSYLDVVVQGFLHQFGQDGATHFFDTTAGWDRPVIDDRTAPIYPRHQTLTAAERCMVDRHLDTLRVTILPRD
jgi:hypothetical protein